MIVRYLREDELTHHGVKGQRWGVRRYQNPDGSLTDAGKKKLKDFKEKEIGKLNKRYEKTLEKYKKAPKEVTLGEYGEEEDVRSDLKKQMKYINKEIKLVKNYSFNDFSAEKKAIGKKAAIKAVAATATFVVPIVPDLVGVALLASIANDKRSYRNKILEERNNVSKKE